MQHKELEGQLGLCIFVNNESHWLTIDTFQFLGKIDDEQSLFVKFTSSGVLSFYVGKFRNVTQLYI
jgi:hypothetical protein